MAQPQAVLPSDDVKDIDYSVEFEVIKSSRPPDDSWEMSAWGVMMIFILLGCCIAAIIFYFSYVHERMKESSKQRAGDVSSDNLTHEERMERGLTIKKWQGFQNSLEENGESTHTVATSIPEESQSSDEDESDAQESFRTMGVNSVGSPPRKDMNQLFTEPRCVLCSKTYEPGEDVAHPDNKKCHHEFHYDCLTRYWGKNKANNHRCPVCKEKFMTSASA